MAASELETKAQQFAESYAALFSSPDACSIDKVAALAAKVSKNYRPGATFFTNGQISRFEVSQSVDSYSSIIRTTNQLTNHQNVQKTQVQAAHLIEIEMKKNISTGLGTCLLLQNIETRAYSDSAVTCWLEWNFRPQAGSEFEGRGWTFTNIYGWRMGKGDVKGGWEYVVRDREVEAMREVTGVVFNE